MIVAVLKSLLIAGVLFYVAAALYLYVTQERRIFARDYVTPCRLERAKPVTLRIDTHTVLAGAHYTPPHPVFRILYFGGNGENAAAFVEHIAPLLETYDVIAFNYPGYDGSGGEPSEKSLLAAAKVQLETFRPDIVIARSLGTAVAIMTAAKYPRKGMVLITPIDSVESVAAAKYPFLPVRYLIRHPFYACDAASSLHIPVALLFAENETLVPKKSIRKLKAALPQVVFEAVANSTHYDIIDTPHFVPTLRKALKALP
jgi:pimeloyl-ACP methyl ester carboxylesterase